MTPCRHESLHTGSGREVVHGPGPGEQTGKVGTPEVVDLQPERWVLLGRRDVGPLLGWAVGRVEGVQPDHRASPIEEQVDEMGADESGRPRHHRYVSSPRLAPMAMAAIFT